MKVNYEIVDKREIFNAYLDGKIEDDEIYVINFGAGKIWDISNLCASEIKDEDIIFMRKINNENN